MTHVRTSPFYPQSNGKIERWHESLKAECVRPGVPLSVEEARRLVGRYVDHYNRVRLHSALGYVTPLAKLEGRETQIFAERDRKLETARRQRQLHRQEARLNPPDSDRVQPTPGYIGSGRHSAVVAAWGGISVDFRGVLRVVALSDR